ncbi:hypothetical protein [Burkholderia glumae]|uniref:hypothetical protein n=1 Tax=Burkholderia glumae TaxID=337 RepID=UPI0020CDA242|nr:hypothetical protein [Burkholderia glumae]MCQ0030984.1 hypothetical protein [Burkholderia glumae]MCQ0035238.1 hypothetical protein [Burkholderia glumae]
MTNDRLVSPWSQAQLSLWLSRRRRDRLRRIAASLPPGATPLDAIDRALDLATAPIFAPRPGVLADEAESAHAAEQLAAMEARLAAIAATLEQVLSAKLDRLAVAVDHVRELALASSSATLMAGSSDFENQTDESAVDEAGEDIAQWLRIRLAVAGATAKDVAVVGATVRLASRSSGSLSAPRFDAILSQVDGRAIRDGLPPGPIIVSDAEANRTLSQLDHGQSICFLCRPSGGGHWAIDAHMVDLAGRTGDAVASFRE